MPTTEITAEDAAEAVLSADPLAEARPFGRRRTCWLALSGPAPDAGTALEWGLVDRVE